MRLTVDIADTPTTLTKGLMGVKHMDQNTGMLFQFASSLEASFWGKDTYIPLDIAFVDSKNKIIDIKQITPMSTKSVRSDGICLMAIEANAGFFKKNEIGVGDTIELERSGDKSGTVNFRK